jgi:hypothetical protein
MFPNTPPAADIVQLKSKIELLQGETAVLQRLYADLVRTVGRSHRRLNYLRLARWLRAPAASYELWRPGLLICGPTIVGAMLFILVDLVADSLSIASFGALIGGAVAAGLLAVLLYRPTDTLLPLLIAAVEAEAQVADAGLRDTIERLTGVTLPLENLRIEHRRLVMSGKLALLTRDWKAMRGYEWEKYLVEVCETLGATVEGTGKVGDQGCDLVVVISGKRIAVQAKGFDDDYAVNHKAVQEAFAGMAYHNCSACAVITNTRFRKSAKKLAAKTGCMLIGEREFSDFVVGSISLSRDSG